MHLSTELKGCNSSSIKSNLHCMGSTSSYKDDWPATAEPSPVNLLHRLIASRYHWSTLCAVPVSPRQPPLLLPCGHSFSPHLCSLPPGLWPIQAAVAPSSLPRQLQKPHQLKMHRGNPSGHGDAAARQCWLTAPPLIHSLPAAGQSLCNHSRAYPLLLGKGAWQAAATVPLWAPRGGCSHFFCAVFEICGHPAPHHPAHPANAVRALLYQATVYVGGAMCW